MMQITNQKKMAAQLLKCGVNRVWIDPHRVDQVATAVQKDTIREHIAEGWIRAMPIQGISRARARVIARQKAKGRRKGHGKRSGTHNARDPRKNRWMRQIRAQRRVLKELRADGTLKPSNYRYYYRKAKGGSYRSIAHMKTQMEIEGMVLTGGES
ncbi:MAG TPA: 50S ribosomal protein L19e [Candidatus Poseidoniales archaeon]|nr:50S ribosomal protein L19e [Candidatus Poseidoniales archaeon]HIO94275.1 50S ribosomal protein L19e [Candidatus Poseidoniales archaeon]